MQLFRPVNQSELDLIIQTNWQAFPPRLTGQPIFYPVLNQEYAEEITKLWNVPSYGVGHVVAFEIADIFLRDYQVQKVGLDHHLEYWIPAEQLADFNRHLVGKIQLIRSFR